MRLLSEVGNDDHEAGGESATVESGATDTVLCSLSQKRFCDCVLALYPDR